MRTHITEPSLLVYEFICILNKNFRPNSKVPEPNWKFKVELPFFFRNAFFVEVSAASLCSKIIFFAGNLPEWCAGR